MSDRLLGRPVCAAGQPASMQVSRCIGLSGSDRKFPGLPGRSGTQRARRPFRPELAAPLSVWPSPQLAQCAAGRDRWRLSGDVAVLRCCPAPASSAHPRSAPPTRQPSTFRSDISQVGADRASVMRCRRSLLLAVGCCCCCHRCCQLQLTLRSPALVVGRAWTAVTRLPEQSLPRGRHWRSDSRTGDGGRGRRLRVASVAATSPCTCRKAGTASTNG